MNSLQSTAEEATFLPKCFERVESQVFFKKEHEAAFRGVSYLVGRCQFGLLMDGLDAELDSDDVQLQLKISHHVSSLTRNQQNEFAILFIKASIDSTIRNLQHPSRPF